MIAHHDGCFGCGQANLFGLQLETDGVRGRFFVKQDHQGERGFAHPGILAAALEEMMSLAAPDARVARLEVEFLAPVPVGVFVDVGATTGSASATVDGKVVAEASADFAVS